MIDLDTRQPVANYFAGKEEIFQRVYIAHPLSAPTEEGRQANRRAASRIAAAVAVRFRVAPSCAWIVLSEHWSEEEGRELGLKLDCASIEVCDQLWLTGPVQPLSSGMQIEWNWAAKCNVTIVDMRGVLTGENPGGA